MRFNPKVTIAIPTFNRATLLRSAIDSVLAQTHPGIELIISDNASTDNTQEILSTYNDNRIVVIRNEFNIGMVPNWNSLLRRATGHYFLLLSDDDFLEKEAVAKLVAAFEWATDFLGSAQSLGFVYCSTRLVDQGGKEITITGPTSDVEPAFDVALNFLRVRRGIYPCSILFRTADLLEIGGFNASKYSVGCDAGAWIEIALRHGFVAHVNQVLSNYRIHPASTTNDTQIQDWILVSRQLRDLLMTFVDQRNHFRRRMVTLAGRKHVAYTITLLLEQSSKGQRYPVIFFVKGIARYFGHLRGWYGLLAVVRVLLKLWSPRFYYQLKHYLVGRRAMGDK